MTYLKDTGVFFDTSFSIGSKAPLTNSTERIPLMQENLLRKMLKNFRSDRILFGSDNPWTSQKESVDTVRSLPLSAADKQKILGENAMRLLFKNV